MVATTAPGAFRQRHSTRVWQQQQAGSAMLAAKEFDLLSRFYRDHRITLSAVVGG
jgi:hypothetical protein